MKTESKKSSHRIRGVLLVTVLTAGFVMLSLCNVHSESINSAGVNGTAYNCFFYSGFDFFNSSIDFTDSIRMKMSGFNGDGIYYSFLSPDSLLNVFVGSYLSFNESLGSVSGDLMIGLTGFTIDPFIFGTGLIIVDHQWISPLVFFGLQMGIEDPQDERRP